jgi:hypothetical protein
MEDISRIFMNPAAEHLNIPPHSFTRDGLEIQVRGLLGRGRQGLLGQRSDGTRNNFLRVTQNEFCRIATLGRSTERNRTRK